MKTLLILSAIFVFSLSINAQNHTDAKIDTCENSTYTPILLLSDGQIIKRELSRKNFQKLDRIAVYSNCHNEYYDVRNFRMVGAAKNQDPVVIAIEGSTISQEHKNAMKHLKGGYRLYFEDISRAPCGTYDGSIAIKVY